MDSTNPEERPEPDPSGAPKLSGRSVLILGIIAIAVVAFFAFIVLDAAGSDDTVAVEETLREILDGAYEKDSLPTWCNGGCSATDDEWHTSDTAEQVANDLAAALGDAGLEALVEAGPDDAFIVKVADGDGLDIGVTGAGWGNASTEAAGTAIWFTSVTLFDQPQVSA